MQPLIVPLDPAPPVPARVTGPARGVRPETRVRLPLMTCSVVAGFPSPADDYIEDVLDLNRHLIRQGHEAATFVVRVTGWSMIGAGIHDGDEVLVDRAIDPREGHVVVACRNGELTIKRLRVKNGKLILAAENPHFADLEPGDGEDWTIWGVATRVLHKL